MRGEGPEVSRLSPDGGTPSEHPSTPLVDTPSSSSTPDQNSPREHDLSNETVRMPLFASFDVYEARLEKYYLGSF